jgi:hypothetical protein
MGIAELRRTYHREICRRILGRRSGVPNLADVSSRHSKAIAEGMITRMGYPICTKPPSGQTAGARFACITRDFLNAAFGLLAHLRPGEWVFSASELGAGIGAYDQYQHLAQLVRVLAEHKELASTFGGDYLVTPDIVIARKPVSENDINRTGKVVGRDVANLTPLRASNSTEPKSILHASISCKWTIRSDRAQNTRTEALNLIRNRKGKTPHIACVVAEPMPTRLASLAMGTGDIDCVYHMALPELTAAVAECEFEDQAEMLDLLVTGRRLRDIGDLPFDLVA